MYRIPLALLLLSCFPPAATNADPITLGTAGVGGEQTTSEPSVQPGLVGRFFWGYETTGPGLFGVTLTADDVGRVFRATAATDPEFVSVAARLTNGINEHVYFSLRFDDGQWGFNEDVESNSFRTTPGPDFPGATITAITYRLDTFSLVDGPSFRHVFYNGILTVEGVPAGGLPNGPDPIPEPATLVLAVTGAAVLARSWKRRRNEILGS